jgi:glycosyltransferase involved in cell wall biosynthesis
MRVCIIGKYPPIQGGVSRENFWMTYALALEGLDIHLVTNAKEVESEYRCTDVGFLPNPLDSLSSVQNKVTVHYTPQARHEYVPWANPFVTKLASIATDVIKTHGCELIHSVYFEPYAVAAHLASRWTGIPYGIRHAGSDVGRLFQAHDLQTSYANIVLSADYLLATARTFRSFLHLGVDLEKLYQPSRHSLPTDYFHPSVSALDVNKFIAVIADTLPRNEYYAVYHRLAHKSFDPTLPTIGIYGKVGEAKGSFDLLQALGKLHATGMRFNFLALNQGRSPAIFEFVKRIEENKLEEVTWLLPFIPHWCIPNFIRACTAVCYLERGFPIKIHTPIIPREVLACGTCLILSHEVANKQINGRAFLHGSNIFLVEPSKIDELAHTLEVVMKEPTSSRVIGMNGYRDLSATIENFDAYRKGLVELFTTIQQGVTLRRNAMSVAEMQAYLARLYTSDSFRKLFNLNPTATFSEYKLADDEMNALRHIDKEMLDLFASSLKGKRKKRFSAAYPLLFKLPDVDLERYYNRYYNLYPARPHESTLQQILEFGEFMEQCLATDEDAPPYASDLVRYERLYYMAAFSPTQQDAFTFINRTDSPPLQTIESDVYPFVLSNVYISTFRFPIVQVAETLQKNQKLSNLKDGTYCFVFQQVARSLTPHIFAISPATRDLLSFCDGAHSLSHIVQGMETLLERECLGEEITKMIQQLQMLKVIGVKYHEKGI